MQELMGPEYAEFEQALEQEPSVSIRVNSEKRDLPTALKPVPWCNTGFYLEERAPFTFDPKFHAGTYYVPVYRISVQFSDSITHTASINTLSF